MLRLKLNHVSKRGYWDQNGLINWYYGVLDNENMRVSDFCELFTAMAVSCSCPEAHNPSSLLAVRGSLSHTNFTISRVIQVLDIIFKRVVLMGACTSETCKKTLFHSLHLRLYNSRWVNHLILYHQSIHSHRNGYSFEKVTVLWSSCNAFFGTDNWINNI